MTPPLTTFVTLAICVIGALAAQNQLVQVTANFGSNPTGVKMYTYRPNGLVANPALIIAMHYCTGTAQAYFTGTQYANLADTHKTFMLVYPTAPDSGGCWDVHSTETLTHDKGGDSLGIASIARYAIQNWGVPKNKVFMLGGSSGAMMTNVMAGAYPDLFVAGAAMAGVPYACFKGTGLWNSDCAQGKIIKTGEQWGDLVRSGYPGYTGQRTRMQIWHGVDDQTLRYQNFLEAVKQWTNVFGYPSTPVQSLANTPLSGWTKQIYGPGFHANSVQGYGHNVPDQPNDILAWFCLTGNGSWCTSSGTTTAPQPTSTTTNNPVPTTTSGGGGATVPRYGQCGGQGYTGPTVCESPYKCTYSNEWYSQCI